MKAKKIFKQILSLLIAASLIQVPVFAEVTENQQQKSENGSQQAAIAVFNPTTLTKNHSQNHRGRVVSSVVTWSDFVTGDGLADFFTGVGIGTVGMTAVVAVGAGGATLLSCLFNRCRNRQRAIPQPPTEQLLQTPEQNNQHRQGMV